MVCSRCPYYAANGGTLKQRQEHCLTCKIDEFPKPYYPIGPGESYTDAVIEKASLVKYQEEAQDDAGAVHESIQASDALDADKAVPTVSAALVDQVAQSEFVQRFSELTWRDQAVILGILKHGDCTQCVASMTHFAISTVWEHRRKLEADAYWKQFIRGNGLRLHTRTRKPRGMPGRKRSPRKSHDCNGTFRETGTAGRRTA